MSEVAFEKMNLAYDKISLATLEKMTQHLEKIEWEIV